MLTPSIITSASIYGIRRFLEEIPGDCEHIEVYAFMNRDLTWLMPQSVLNRVAEKSALAVMAEAKRQGVASEVAHELDKSVRLKRRNISICGFATFIPEMSLAEERSSLWESAQDALCFLVEVVRELRKLKHQCHSIELVAGSRIESFDRTDGAYRVSRLWRDVALQRVVTRLEKVASFAMGTCVADRVYLALELEPGPLFAISDKSSLMEFSRRISAAAPEIQSIVGVNLDIPHWDFLAGIDAAAISSVECALAGLTPRIVHAHISDHYKAHFSDQAIGQYHDDTDFLKWINLLRKIGATNRASNFPLFGGFISLELEAVCSASIVESSFSRLRKFLTPRDPRDP